MSTRLLRSGVIYAGANVLAAGVPFLLLPLLTRALSPSEYGEVVSFFMLVSVTTGIAGLSMHGAVGVRWLDLKRGDPRSLTGTATLLAVISTAVAAGAAALIAPSVGIELSPGTCALAAVSGGSITLQGMRFAVWQSQGNALAAAALQVMSASLNVGLSLVAVLLLHQGGGGRIHGAVLAGVLIAAFSVGSLYRQACMAKPTAAETKAALRFGLPLIPHALAGALMASLDRFAVSAQLGTAALGVYGTAAQLGQIINVLADAAMKASTPQLYKMLSQDTVRARLRLVAISYFSVPVWILVALVLWVVLQQVGTILLGDRYLEALHLSVWFLLGGAFGGAYLTISSLFFFTGKTECISVATLTASAAAAVIAPFAVSRYGTVGGAIAYCAVQATLLLAAWMLSMRIKPLPWKRPALATRTLFRRRGIA